MTEIDRDVLEELEKDRQALIGEAWHDRVKPVSGGSEDDDDDDDDDHGDHGEDDHNLSNQDPDSDD